MQLFSSTHATLRRTVFALGALFVALACLPAAAAAEADNTALTLTLIDKEERDLTDRVLDNDPNSFAAAADKQVLHLTFRGKAPYALALEWHSTTGGALAVQLDAAGNILSEDPAADDTLMRLLPLDPACRTVAFSNAALSEVRTVASEEEAGALYLPEPAAQVDLMLIAAHAGDEAALFTELLPHVSEEDAHETMTVFLSAQNRLAKREALLAQQAAGIDTEPLFLDALYRHLDTAYADQAKRFWDRRVLLDQLVSAIRRHRPAVIVTHDPDDAADSMHRWTSALVQEAVTLAANETFAPDSVKLFGAWQVQKLYVLQAGDDGSCTRPAAQGIGTARRTRMQTVLDCYSTLRLYHLRPAERCVLRLVFSAVGEDETKHSIFEHLTPAPKTSAVQGTVFPFPLRDVQTNEGNDPNWNSYFSDDGTETVVEDPDNGHWAYTSDTLSVRIDRHEIAERPLVYFIAHIRMREINAYRSGFGYYDERGSAKMEPWKMARTYCAVLALTGDNLINDETSEKGTLLRNGRIYSRRDAQPTMALCSDMTIRLFERRTMQPEDYLAEGIEHTYGFGPILVKDGKFHEAAKNHRVNGLNPRAAIGMVAPGHYVAIVVDGRNPAYSRGCDYDELAELFIGEGCTVAYNMDGGVSAGMVFMGESINLHNSSRNVTVSGQRPWPDGLLFGYSELVPSVDDPIYNTGNRDELQQRPNE